MTCHKSTRDPAESVQAKRNYSLPFLQNHIHLSLSREPTARDSPILVWILQYDIKVSVELNNDLSQLHHGEVLADAVSRSGSELFTISFDKISMYGLSG